MILALSRALLILASRCLGEARHEWGHAMQIEFDAAIEDGRPLPFAFGCLWGTLREMPLRQEGRFALTSYVLALALMIPMATVQIGCAAFNLPYLFAAQAHLPDTLTPGQALLFGGAYRAAMLPLTLLLMLSAGGQLRIAWLLLERDWPRVTSAAIANLAAVITVILFVGSVFLDLGRTLNLSAVLIIELAVLWGLSRWHAAIRVPPDLGGT